MLPFAVKMEMSLFLRNFEMVHTGRNPTILTLIEDHPLSVPALIEHLGITEEEYNTWEADTGDSFMTMLDKIAEFYEVPVEYLTEGKVI